MHIFPALCTLSTHPAFKWSVAVEERAFSFFLFPFRRWSKVACLSRFPYFSFLSQVRRCTVPIDCVLSENHVKSEGFPTSVSLTFPAKKVHRRGERMNYLSKKAPLLACKATREECNPPFPHLFSSVRRKGGRDRLKVLLSLFSPPPFFSP